MIHFLFCTVLPPGGSKVDQTYKFDTVIFNDIVVK